MCYGVGKACLEPNYVNNLRTHKNLLGEKIVLCILFPFEKHMRHRVVVKNGKQSKCMS